VPAGYLEDWHDEGARVREVQARSGLALSHAQIRRVGLVNLVIHSQPMPGARAA